MAEAFTEREVQIYQAGMCKARDIAQRSGKGLTAAKNIQRHITDNNLLFEKCRSKGVFGMINDLQPAAPSPHNPGSRPNSTAGRTALLCLAVFLFPILCAVIAEPGLQRQDDAAQELTSVAFFDPDPVGPFVETYSPEYP